MKKIKWKEQIEDISIEYDVLTESRDIVESTEITIDKMDCLIAASSGIFTAMLDVLWVGEFSLRYAQDIGTEQINSIVIAIAQKNAIAKGKPCPKDDLKSCIKFLEKEYPLATDRLINEFGGGVQHHLRDFSHHASPFGLICSILNQFTNRGYGTDTDGRLIKPNIPGTEAIGTTFEDKITLGVVSWFFHLVSDMAGSSSNVGRGTGIPGPILSLAKVLSLTPMFKELKIRYKEDDIGLSVWISKLFNGTAFEHAGHKDIVRFDLRTEMGIANFSTKQSVPVIINQCIVRSLYFIRRLEQEFTEKNISSLGELKLLDTKRFLPFNNRAITHMITISTGVFSIIDGADAVIRARINNVNDLPKTISNTLLRLNFVGIGAFAISIKNEIKYVAQELNCIKGKKTKAQQLLEQRDTQAEAIKHIDVEVDMDNRNLYRYTFDNLTNMVVLSREKLLNSYMQVDASIGKIFNLGEGNFNVHKMIVEANETRAVKAIEALVVKMCEQNNIPFEYYPIDARYENCEYDIQTKLRPFQMIRNENNKRVGYVFCDSDKIEKFISAFKAGKYRIDSIKIVRLNAPNQDTYKLRYETQNNRFKENGISARLITIEELFDAFFGEDEYSIFVEYVNRFNSKAKELIGFNTVLAPTDMALVHFKAKTGKRLEEYPYRDFIPQDVYPSQVEILFNNYLERKLWMAMIGTADFAISFISSEWNYHVYQLTENLDMTGIVAGYLKSIEQLLFCVFSISEHKRISIKSREGRIVDFSNENENLIDLTLGSLESAIQHNGHILDVSSYVKRHLVETIGEWRNKQRNGYFHRKNLNSIEKVDEIRNKAIYLYFLILGSATIKDEQFEKLGIVTVVENNDFSYEAFVSWLEPILKYGLPKDTVAVSLILYDTTEGIWSMQLHGLKTFDENTPFYLWEDSFNSGHNSYKWVRKQTEKEAVHMISSAVRKYLEVGACKDKLSIYQALSVGGRSYREFPYSGNISV